MVMARDVLCTNDNISGGREASSYQLFPTSLLESNTLR